MICSGCKKDMDHFYTKDGSFGIGYELPDPPEEPIYCHKCFTNIIQLEKAYNALYEVSMDKVNNYQINEEKTSKLNTGLKHDTGKKRWDLLPVEEVEEIVNILTFGANKYSDNSWQNVDNGVERYYAALLRHIVAWRKGEINDKESGFKHLSHAACNMIFLLYLTNPRNQPKNVAEPMDGAGKSSDPFKKIFNISTDGSMVQENADKTMSVDTEGFYIGSPISTKLNITTKEK